MKKTRVLILNDPDTLNNVTYWRLYRPFALLQQEHGDQLEIHYNRGQLLPTDLLTYDVYFAIRPSLPAHLYALQAIREHDAVAGYTRPIILDFDDNNGVVPMYHVNFKDEGANFHITEKCVALATEIWCSTAPVARQFGKVKTTIVPNAILPEDIADRPTTDMKRIIWAGTIGHAHDILHETTWWGGAKRFGHVAWANEIGALAEIFEWIGYLPPLRLGDNWMFTQHMPITQFFRHIRGASVWWKPLLNIPFNDAKSNIALLSATCAGAVCVTNYHRSPGWEESLGEVPATPKQHAEAWQRAREMCLLNYDLRYVNLRRVQSLLNAAGILTKNDSHGLL